MNVINVHKSSFAPVVVILVVVVSGVLFLEASHAQTPRTPATSSSSMISGVYSGDPSECTGDSGPSCATGVSNLSLIHI